MEKQYDLANCSIRVYFQHQLVKIEEANAIKDYLSYDIGARSQILVNAIKLDYSIFFGKELNIKNNSMVVEIWGHSFASHFANSLTHKIKAKLAQKISRLD